MVRCHRGNHRKIFAAAGLKQIDYRYWKPATRGLDLDGMLADLRAAPKGSAVLLHACAHNPTGVDPTERQWQAICRVMQECGHLAFFDCAYQGYATGDLDRDAYAVRHFAAQGVPLLIAQSYSKNMGLYGERVGCASVLCAGPATAKAVQSQLAALIRPMYSNPPRHGPSTFRETPGYNESAALRCTATSVRTGPSFSSLGCSGDPPPSPPWTQARAWPSASWATRRCARRGPSS